MFEKTERVSKADSRQAVIRPITRSELPLLADFAPPEWNTDLSATFSFHFGQPYYYPIVADIDGKIVGCAQGLLNGDVGWLGNIVVLAPYRGTGIGGALTSHLVEFFSSMHCKSQILTATKLGESVYRKLGFQTVTEYVFLSCKERSAPEDVPGVRTLHPRDSIPVLELDRAISGEAREPFLGRFLTDGWVHESPAGEIDGYFLPRLAHGPVLAENERAGLALLRFKVGCGSISIIVPEPNSAALEFLSNIGFQETARAPRMILKKDAGWQPRCVFSRGSGYSG